MRRSSFFAAICCGTLAASLLAAPSQAHSNNREPDTVASGLAGPLTMAIDKHSNLYVTQSFAGLLTKIDREGNRTNLVEYANPDGEIVGASVGKGGVYYIQTDYAGGTSTVNRVDSKGRSKVVSRDLMAYEAKKNPDRKTVYGFTNLNRSCAQELKAFEEANAGMLPPLSRYKGIVESHGYQTSVTNKGDVYVADAAANAILKVNGRSGTISTVAVIPATPVTFTAEMLAAVEGQMGIDAPDCLANQRFVPEPVPTDVEIGKGGMLYVSTLQGWLGEMQPLSKVYRVNPWNGKAKALAGGMHGATGVALLRNDVVVAEMFAGEVSIIKNGKKSAKTLFTVDSPADVETKGTTIYATAGVFGDGSVVRYRTR